MLLAHSNEHGAFVHPQCGVHWSPPSLAFFSLYFCDQSLDYGSPTCNKDVGRKFYVFQQILTRFDGSKVQVSFQIGALIDKHLIFLYTMLDDGMDEDPRNYKNWIHSHKDSQMCSSYVFSRRAH